MDFGHLKKSELDKQFQTSQGRVAQDGDVVKDDSGSYAVFTEPGSSASHMVAAQVLDLISRLPGYAGQASVAVSAYTQVKLEDDPKSLGLPESGCPAIWIRLPTIPPKITGRNSGPRGTAY